MSTLAQQNAQTLAKHGVQLESLREDVSKVQKTLDNGLKNRVASLETYQKVGAWVLGYVALAVSTIGALLVVSWIKG